MKRQAAAVAAAVAAAAAAAAAADAAAEALAATCKKISVHNTFTRNSSLMGLNPNLGHIPIDPPPHPTTTIFW